MPHQSARTERRRARQTNALCYRSILNVQTPQSTSHYGADEPYTYSSRRYRVPPAVAKNHQDGSNFRFSTNDFDCAGRGALTSEGPHRIDHAHGYGSNFYRSEHRHSNCPCSRCLSVALARSICCATLAAECIRTSDPGLCDWCARKPGKAIGRFAQP